MKNLSSIALLLSLSLSFTALSFGQSRARRVGQTPGTSVPPNSSRTADSNSTTVPKSGKAQEAPEEVGDDAIVRVNTTLVTIPVSVTDRDGRFIYDLRKEDFQVYDNGEQQEVAYFASVEKPFTVVLVIDTSTSIWSKLDEVREAAIAFLDQLRPEDQVMIVSFAKGLSIACEPTTDRQVLREAIWHVGKGSSTHLYDAMERVMSRELTRFQGRKAVVLFTDGVDSSSSRATYESNVQDAEELDALIYPIRFDTYSPEDDPTNSRMPRGGRSGGGRSGGGGIGGILADILMPGGITIGSGGGRRGGGGPTVNTGGNSGSTRAEYEHGRQYLYDMAEKTGGRVYEASEERSSMDAAFRNIAEELRHQYSLGYYPRTQARAGEQRHIKVRSTRPNLAVRSRETYVFNPSASAGTVPDSGQDQPRQASPPVLRKPLVAHNPGEGFAW